MSAEAILGVHTATHQDADAWQPLPWIGVISSAGWRAAGPGDRVDRYQRVDELCEQMATVCASAVDPLEIAAALEFEGMADRTVRERYGFPDVFALAEEMYQRVPRQPTEPAPVHTARHLGIGRSTLRGLIYGLPAVCFPAAEGLLAGPSATPVLIVSMLLSWAAGQALAYLGYRRLGWTGAGETRRLLRPGIVVALALVACAVLIAAISVRASTGTIAFGLGQAGYMLSASVLMVLGRERLIAAVLAPSVLGAAAFLLLGRPATLEHAMWAALAATPVLALLAAYAHTRPSQYTPTGRLITLSEVRAALPRLAFGILAPALVVVPIVLGLAGRADAGIAVTLLAVPLALSMGAAEWCVSRYRRTTQRMLRKTSRLGQFGGRARLALLGATVQYLTAITALTCAASLIAVNLSPIRLDRAMIAILVGGIALGGAMFIALLLLAFDRCEITVLACAGAVGGELLFRGWGPAVVSYLGLLALLGGYALVVLGRAGRMRPSRMWRRGPVSVRPASRPVQWPGGGRVRAVVPAYFHPVADPFAWERLAQHANAVRMVVLNVSDGPGDRPDPAFRPVLERLTEAGVTVAGYVDTDYGRRSIADALIEMGAYLDWYGLCAAFLDQVSSGHDDLDHYAILAEKARLLGVRLLAFNHGTHPVEEYADHAELLGTFEGPWRAYAETVVPNWVWSRPPEQFYHLLYSVPRARHAEACALVANRGAGGAFVTDHGGANPWDYLPDDLFPCLAASP